MQDLAIAARRRIDSPVGDTKRVPDEVDGVAGEKNKLFQHDFSGLCRSRTGAAAAKANHSRALSAIPVFHMLLILDMVLIISSRTSP